MEVISSSVFRFDPEKSNHKHNKGIAAQFQDGLFLRRHMDSNSFPALFLSWSTKDAYVHHFQGNDVIGRLRVPAGLSLVYTTEIHTGNKQLNPSKLLHCSTSAPDRFLFRIVHTTLEDHPFDLLQRNLLQKLKKSPKTINQRYFQRKE